MKKHTALLLSLSLGITTIGTTLPMPVMAAETVGATSVAMLRLYNPNSGEHFYTCDEGEKSDLVTTGWRYEGVGWKAPIISDSPVYRLYNANAGDHHYTLNVNEKDNLVRLGWNYEGIGWYSDDEKSVPLYREYNPNAVTGTHNYTTNKAEHDNLVKLGWRDEEIGWYGIKDKDDPIDDPVDPTEPEDPTEPTDPTDPTDPVDPVEPTDPTEPTEPEEPGDDLKIGDIVILGSYEQDNNLTNGAEPIEWQYIANKDGHKYLMSKYALNVKRYNAWTDITWENCELREWLNNDFYNTAFSASDKQKIVTAHNENPDSYELLKNYYNGVKDRGDYGAEGGNPTDDKVFLMSWTEARDYLDGRVLDWDYYWGYDYKNDPLRYNPKLLCKPTAYTIAQQEQLSSGLMLTDEGYCDWWLRSPGMDQRDAISIQRYCGLLGAGSGVDIPFCICVRPAILID